MDEIDLFTKFHSDHISKHNVGLFASLLTICFSNKTQFNAGLSETLKIKR